MFANVLKHPYIDILKLFAKDEWARAHVRGDVRQVIDKLIGKRVFELQGLVSAANFLALPRAGLSLGLDARYLFLQLRMLEQQLYSLHLDVLTDRKFVLRISLSNRYMCAKRIGSVLQLPCPQLDRQRGRWTTLCVDLPALLQAHLGVKEGCFLSLKGITVSSTVLFRAAVVSDTLFTPETLPRDMMLPLTSGRPFAELYGWERLPEPSFAFGSGADFSPPSPGLTERTPTAVARVRRPPPPVDTRAARALFRPAQATSPVDPALLKLRRVVGFSGEKHGQLVWLQDGRTIAYAVAALLILQDLETHEQRSLMGHSANICAISAASASPLIASAQEGPLALVRLWDRAAGVCLAILQQHHSDMQALHLSPRGSYLAGVGKDSRGRQLLAVWDVRGAFDAVPSCPVVDAKVSLHHTRRLAWVPPRTPTGAHVELPAAEEEAAMDGLQLVSCGYENIRFWRLKRGKLHSCGLALQHHEGQMFLDIAIDTSAAGGGGATGEKQRRMLVGSSLGHLFQVDLTTRRLEYVFALHEAPINSVILSAGFAVTGSDDRKLRVWPLDFASHFLEADHEGCVTALSASPDGLKLLIGTSSGSIGVLDVSSIRHVTLVRSHTDIIYGLAMDPHNREFATASCDGSIRVWELDGAQQQLVEFELPQGCARCIAYHPTEYAIACGFDEGCVRVFDIASTSLLEEYKQHDDKVLALGYSGSAKRLFSAAADGGLCAYDVLHAYQPCRAYAASPHADSPCLAVSPDDVLLVVGGLQATALLLFDCSSMTLLKSVTLQTDAHALCFGPMAGVCRYLFCSTADNVLLTLHVTNPKEGDLDVDVSPSPNVVPGFHRAVCETLAPSINGRFLASGGNDHMVKVWPMDSLCGASSAASTPRSQAFVGHSDHVTKLQFSPDGASLVSVGGGDAIFIWDFCGGEGVDPTEVVEESVLAAAREREAQANALRAGEEGGDEVVPSPNEFLSSKSTHHTAATLQMCSQLPADQALQAAVMDLKGRMQALEMDDPEGSPDRPEPREAAKYQDASNYNSPHKLYKAQPTLKMEASDPLDEDGARVPEGGTDGSPRLGSDEEWIGVEGEPDSLATRMAEGLQLSRLIGFNTSAHDHVLWQQAEGILIYSSGDTLVLDPLRPDARPVYACTETGEISTLALSPSARYVAVGCGITTALLVYDVKQNSVELFSRLTGHDGGVQSLTFLGEGVLVSLGLNDCAIRVHAVSSGLLICCTRAPAHQLTLATCGDIGELTTGGEGGVFSWQIEASSTKEPRGHDEGRAVALHALERRVGTEALCSGGAQVTALLYLEETGANAWLLAGDSEGNLVLWPPTGEKPAVCICAPSLMEVDLLNASPVPTSAGGDSGSCWRVVAGGAGPTNAVHQYMLTFSSEGTVQLDLLGEIVLDGAAVAMSWAGDMSQGVVGTSGGSLWHLHWESMSTTALMSVGAATISQLAVPLEAEKSAPVIASVSASHSSSGLLLWPSRSRCSAPVARVHMPEDDAKCSALSTDESETLCVMGHSSGELRLVEVSSLEVVAGIQAHHASVCCVSFCYVRRGERCIISAASDGEVRLFALNGGTAESDHQMQLTRLAMLRPATGVRVHSLDVLRSLSTGSCSHWLVSSEHQQVQVWPLPDAALTPADPILTIELEPEPLLVVPHELAAIGWRCLAAFCPHHHQVIACCGLTRERRLLFYDFVQRQPLMAVPLPEWPTSLAFSRCAPLLAIAGARGRVILISYPQFGAFYPFLGVAKLDVVNISLHTRTVNSVYFGGNVLHSATDREIAEWQLPST